MSKYCSSVMWMDGCALSNKISKSRAPSELDEMKRLEASITKRAQAIQCPEGYGEKQANLEDRYFYRRLERVRLGKTLTPAEDVEDALSIARSLVYQESPEGQARQRILQLRLRQFSHELDEHEE